jgi:hypothetical protein
MQIKLEDPASSVTVRNPAGKPDVGAGLEQQHFPLF